MLRCTMAALDALAASSQALARLLHKRASRSCEPPPTLLAGSTFSWSPCSSLTVLVPSQAALCHRPVLISSAWRATADNPPSDRATRRSRRRACGLEGGKAASAPETKQLTQEMPHFQTLCPPSTRRCATPRAPKRKRRCVERA